MSARTEIYDLVQQADRLPWSAECGAVLAEAVARADAAGVPELAYAARMRMCANASWLGDDDLTLSTFIHCWQQHKTDPVRFPVAPELDGEQYEFGDLHWMWKWIPTLMLRNPDVPLDDIAEAIDELEQVYRGAGIPLKAVLQRRLEFSVVTGQLDDVGDLLARLAAMPDDDYSDCEACAPSREAEALLALGRDAEALQRYDLVSEGQFSCGDEPEEMLSLAVLPLVRAGRIEEADAAHRRCYQLSRSDADKADKVGRLIRFYVLTGYVERALTLVRRHLGWLAYSPYSLATHRRMLIGVGLACDAAAEIGLRDRPEPAADDDTLVSWFGSRPGGHTLASLGAAAWEAADELSRRFDARHGNDCYTAETAAFRAERPGQHAVALTVPQERDEAFREAPLTGGYAGGELLTIAPATEPDRHRAEGLLETPPASYADEVAILAGLQRHGTPEQRCHGALRLARAAVSAGRPGDAQAAASFAHELAGIEQLAEHRQVSLAVAAVLRSAEALDAAREILDGLLGQDDLDDHQLAEAVHELGVWQAVAGEPLQAVDSLLDAAELFETLGAREQEVEAAVTAAEVLARRGMSAPAVGVAEAALSELAEAATAIRWRAARVVALERGRLVAATAEECEVAVLEALAAAEAVLDDAELRLAEGQLRAAHARALASRERFIEAVVVAGLAAASYDDAGDTGEASLCRDLQRQIEEAASQAAVAASEEE